MEYYEDEELIEKKKKTKKKIKIIIIIAAVIIGLFFILLVMLSKYAVPVDHRKFDNEIISMIENEYMISLDNAEPKRYWKPRLAQDTISCFNFYTEDYKAFMDGFYGKEILDIYEEPDGSYAIYRCHVKDKYYFSIEFLREGNRYKGILDYYRYIG